MSGDFPHNSKSQEKTVNFVDETQFLPSEGPNFEHFLWEHAPRPLREF